MGTLNELFEKIKDFGIRSDLLPKSDIHTDAVIFMEATSPLWIDMFCYALAHDILPTDSFPSTGTVAKILSNDMACIRHWYNILKQQQRINETDDLYHIDTMIQSLINLLSDVVQQVFVACQETVEKYLAKKTLKTVDAAQLVGYFRFYAKEITRLFLQCATLNTLSRYIVTNTHVMRAFYQSFYNWFWSTLSLELMYIKIDNENAGTSEDQWRYETVKDVNNFINMKMHWFLQTLHAKVFHQNKAYQVPDYFDNALGVALESVIDFLFKDEDFKKFNTVLAQDVISQWLLFAINLREESVLVQGNADIDLFLTHDDIGAFNFIEFIPSKDDEFPAHVPVTSTPYQGNYTPHNVADVAAFWEPSSSEPLYQHMRVFTRPMHSLDAVVSVSWMCQTLLNFPTFKSNEIPSAENTHAKTVFAIQGLPEHVPFLLTPDEKNQRFEFDEVLAKFIKPTDAQFYADALRSVSGDNNETSWVRRLSSSILSRITFHYQQLEEEEQQEEDGDDEKTVSPGLDAINNEFENHTNFLNKILFKPSVNKDTKNEVVEQIASLVDRLIDNNVPVDKDELTQFDNYLVSPDAFRNDLQKYAKNYYAEWIRVLTQLLNNVDKADRDQRRAIESKIKLLQDYQRGDESEGDEDYTPEDDDEDEEEDDYAMDVDEKSSESEYEDAFETQGPRKRTRPADQLLRKGSPGKASIVKKLIRTRVASNAYSEKTSPKDIILATNEMMSRKNISIAVVMLAKDINSVKRLLYTETPVMKHVFDAYVENCEAMKRKNYTVFDGSLAIVTHTPRSGILFSYQRLLDCLNDGQGSGVVNYLKTLSIGITNGMDALLDFPAHFSEEAELIATGKNIGNPKPHAIDSDNNFNVFFVPIPLDERAQVNNSVCVSCLLNKKATNIYDWFIDELAR